MLAKGRPGKVVNIASLLSFQGGIRVPAYTAAKHGVAGLTKLLANEWAAKGINVNAIAPGYIETNNTEALRADAARNKAILERIPAGRWGILKTSPGRRFSSPRRRPTMCMAPSSMSMVAGWRANARRFSKFII